jgi:hypothetical protein
MVILYTSFGLTFFLYEYNLKGGENMKKLMTSVIIILAVGLAMVLLGSLLQGVVWGAGFNGVNMANALVNLGYICAMLSGVVLTGLGVAKAVRHEDCDCKDKDKNKEAK